MCDPYLNSPLGICGSTFSPFWDPRVASAALILVVEYRRSCRWKVTIRSVFVNTYINVKYEVSEDVFVYFDENPKCEILLFLLFLVADRFFSWYCGGYFWTSA